MQSSSTQRAVTCVGGHALEAAHLSVSGQASKSVLLSQYHATCRRRRLIGRQLVSCGLLAQQFDGVREFKALADCANAMLLQDRIFSYQTYRPSQTFIPNQYLAS